VAGAGYTARTSAYRKELAADIEAAIAFQGFSVLDIWGVCPGRYTKRNKITPATIESSMAALLPAEGPVPENARPEYGRLYRERAAAQAAPAPPRAVEAVFSAPRAGRQEMLILGSAGQRVVTAGELLCLAGMTGGLRATLKNDYPITVLRGHSVSEVVLSDEEIGYTGIESPRFVLALAQEGVDRKKQVLAGLDANAAVIAASDVDLPGTGAEVIEIDFKEKGVRPPDRALAALAILAGKNEVVSTAMLEAALKVRFRGEVLEKAMSMVKNVGTWLSDEGG
jgi:Pyruvate/2-oxoacid:ferredoxin oxidoreductase gamma subunit